MYIWRVENEDKCGCYSIHDIELEDMYIKHSIDYEKYPRPKEDIGINRDINSDEICGFKTQEQALNWFDEEDLKLLSELGFTLKKVYVDKITAIGEKQVLAIRQKTSLSNLPEYLYKKI